MPARPICRFQEPVAVVVPVIPSKSYIQLIKESLSDDKGLGDIAYISIAALTVSAITSLSHILILATIDYGMCWYTIEKQSGPMALCSFNPVPTGQAAGLIFGAFAALIGALAAYVVATRRKTT